MAKKLYLCHPRNKEGKMIMVGKHLIAHGSAEERGRLRSATLLNKDDKTIAEGIVLRSDRRWVILFLFADKTVDIGTRLRVQWVPKGGKKTEERNFKKIKVDVDTTRESTISEPSGSGVPIARDNFVAWGPLDAADCVDTWSLSVRPVGGGDATLTTFGSGWALSWGALDAEPGDTATLSVTFSSSSTPVTRTGLVITALENDGGGDIDDP
jgi:hypothetical protein